MKFVSFIADFFRDQDGGSSSKRIVTYAAVFMLYMIVKASLNGKSIDFNVLVIVAGLILFGIGAITAEFFKDKLNK